MRIGIMYRNENGLPIKNGEDVHLFKHLLIENHDDLLMYAKHFSNISSEKSVNALMGFKSQNFRRSILGYLSHESPSACAITKTIAFKLDVKNTDTSIIDYCEMVDSLILRKINSIQKYLNDGKIVRVNQSGGYCPLLESDIYEYYIDINDKELSTFINTGDIEDSTLVINNETVVIENSKNCWGEYINVINKKFGEKNVQILNSFKIRSIGMKDEDYFNLISNGVKKGLKNICFETTGQDMYHLKKMYFLLLNIKEKYNINIFYTSNFNSVKELFKNIGNEIKIK